MIHLKYSCTESILGYMLCIFNICWWLSYLFQVDIVHQVEKEEYNYISFLNTNDFNTNLQLIFDCHD